MTKIDKLVELALKYPNKTAAQLKALFEKRGETVSMPVVYEARKRAALQLEEFVEETNEHLDKTLESQTPTVSVDPPPPTDSPENGKVGISVGIVGLGEPSWTSFDIPAEDVEKTSQALEDLQNRIENRTNCVDLMAVLALTQTYGKSIVLDMVSLVESLGVEKVRGVVNLIEEK